MLRLGLRAKLLASFVLILLPILGLLVYTDSQANERQIDIVLDDQMQTARAVAAVVDGNLDEAVVLATALANNPLVQTLDPSRIDPYLERLAPYYPQYETLAAINRAGDNVGISAPLPSGTNRKGLGADRPYFRQIMATGQDVVSPVLISRATGRPTMVVGVPVRDEAGNIAGAAVVTPYLEVLSARLESVGLLPGQLILLADTMGVVAFQSGVPDTAARQRDLSGFEPVRAAQEGRATEVRRYVSPLLGDTRIGAFTPTPKYHWIVGVSQTEDAALAAATIALREQVLGLGAIAVLSAGLILLLSHLLLQPVRRLGDHAKALGKGDLSRRVSIKTGDEMEKLGDAFNDMAERLDRTLRDLRAVLDATQSGILMYDRNLVVRLVNRRMAEWFGIDTAEVVGQPYSQVAGEFLAPTLAEPEKLLARIAWLAEHPDETILEDVELVRPEHRVLRLYAGPVRADNERIGYIDVYTDITDLRRREQERQALGQVAAALVREMSLERVAAIIVEQGQHVLRAHTVALFSADRQREELRLIAHRGLSAESVAGLSTLTFSARFLTARAARTGRPQGLSDALAVGPALADSRQLAEREGQRGMFAHPLLAKGRLVGVLTIALKTPHDFSQSERELIGAFADLCASALENARLYLELGEMLELREEFITAAAHELKTPVTTIKGYAQAMRKWAPEEHGAREGLALEVIDRQCDRISRRVQEMLEAVRLRHSPPEQHRVQFDLGDLASEVIKRLQPTTQHRLLLHREAPAVVAADRERIEEVLVCLLDNAIKFSPQGGDVQGRVFVQEREAIFAVHDYGVGIAKERQPHIFEPFYEAAPAGAPGYLGMAALSLYLSKLTVELHKGRIWFESDEGKGSTFFFALPVTEGSA